MSEQALKKLLAVLLAWRNNSQQEEEKRRQLVREHGSFENGILLALESGRRQAYDDVIDLIAEVTSTDLYYTI